MDYLKHAAESTAATIAFLDAKLKQEKAFIAHNQGVTAKLGEEVLAVAEGRSSAPATSRTSTERAMVAAAELQVAIGLEHGRKAQHLTETLEKAHEAQEHLAEQTQEFVARAAKWGERVNDEDHACHKRYASFHAAFKLGLASRAAQDPWLESRLRVKNNNTSTRIM